MSDLSELQSAGITKVIGSDSTGVEQTPVQSTPYGGLHSNLRDASGNEMLGQKAMASSLPVVVSGDQSYPFSNTNNAPIPAKSLLLGGDYLGTLIPVAVDADGKLAVTSTVISSIPTANITASGAINASATVYTTYTAAEKIAIKQLYAGGTGIGKQELKLYRPAVTSYVNEGSMENSAAIGTTWVWTSTAGTGSLASSTTQFYGGARSVALTFSNSSGTNAQGIKQSFATPVDYSGWRYLSAQFYNVVSAGGAYTRTISVILTDSAANTRLYTVSGLSTASPFNASGWIQILGELENPTSSTGTAFDPTAISSIELRMTDSANRAGTVYWDTVLLSAQLVTIFPIYHQANSSFNIAIDPVVVLAIGDQILISQKNNDTSRKEFFAVAAGVALS